MPIWAFLVVAVVLFGLVGEFALDQVNITSKVLTSPGSTRDITPMLVLDDAMSYRSKGEIRMVTVKSNRLCAVDTI